MKRKIHEEIHSEEKTTDSPPEMVTRAEECDFKDVGNASSRLCQLLLRPLAPRMSSPTGSRYLSPVQSQIIHHDSHNTRMAANAGGVLTPTFSPYLSAELKLPLDAIHTYGHQENGVFSTVLQSASADQPLDFSLKKTKAATESSSSHVNGSANKSSPEFLGDATTSCFTPSPSPPENSTISGQLLASATRKRDANVATFPATPLLGSEYLVAGAAFPNPAILQSPQNLELSGPLILSTTPTSANSKTTNKNSVNQTKAFVPIAPKRLSDAASHAVLSNTELAVLPTIRPDMTRSSANNLLQMVPHGAIVSPSESLGPGGHFEPSGAVPQNNTKACASKFVRPFKAYPRNTLQSPAASMSYYSYYQAVTSYGNMITDPEVVAMEGMLAKASDQKYQLFRQVFKAERQSTELNRRHQLNLGSKTKTNKTLNQKQNADGVKNNGGGSWVDPSNSSASSSGGHSPNGTVGSSDEVQQKPTGECNSSTAADNRRQPGSGEISIVADAERLTAGGANANQMTTQDSSNTEIWSHSTTNESAAIPQLADSAGSASSAKKMKPASTVNGRLGDAKRDETYWERRRRNNEAAKRSRDARRQKEDEITIRATFLEHENRILRMELAALKNENERLKCQFYAGVASTPALVPPPQFLGLDTHAAS